MYYRSADGEWTEVDNLTRIGVDPAKDADRQTITIVEGTLNTAVPFDPDKISQIMQKLAIYGELATTEDDNVNPLTRANNVKQKHYKGTDPTEAAKALAVLEGKPLPKGIPAVARRIAGRNDPCPCGSGRKYKKCHLG